MNVLSNSKFRKYSSLSAAIVIASGMSLMSVAPATASSSSPGSVAATSVPSADEAHFEAEIVDETVQISLSNAQAVLQEDGSVEVLDNNGDILEVMPTVVPGLDGAPDAEVSYEVADEGASIVMTPENVSQIDNGLMQTRGVDRDCAAPNVFWGIGVGVATGIAGGPAGMAGGAIIGAGTAGIQSIIHC